MSALILADATAITTAFTSIQADALEAIGAVAPIAIAIFGALFLWRIGKRFFSSIAK